MSNTVKYKKCNNAPHKPHRHLHIGFSPSLSLLMPVYSLSTSLSLFPAGSQSSAASRASCFPLTSPQRQSGRSHRHGCCRQHRDTVEGTSRRTHAHINMYPLPPLSPPLSLHSVARTTHVSVHNLRHYSSPLPPPSSHGAGFFFRSSSSSFFSRPCRVDRAASFASTWLI